MQIVKQIHKKKYGMKVHINAYQDGTYVLYVIQNDCVFYSTDVWVRPELKDFVKKIMVEEWRLEDSFFVGKDEIPIGVWKEQIPQIKKQRLEWVVKGDGLATARNGYTIRSNKEILDYYRTAVSTHWLRLDVPMKITMRIDKDHKLSDIFLGFIGEADFRNFNFQRDHVGETPNSWGIFLFNGACWNNNESDSLVKKQIHKGDTIQFILGNNMIQFQSPDGENYVVCKNVTQRVVLSASFGCSSQQITITQSNLDSKAPFV